MMQTMVQSKLAPVTGLAAGFATFMEYLPAVSGALVSLASLVWIGIQAYYFIKEKRAKKD